MNNQIKEKDTLQALEKFLDLTDMSDWHMLHAVVAQDVKSGKYHKDFGLRYQALVDSKILEREAE